MVVQNERAAYAAKKTKDGAMKDKGLTLLELMLTLSISSIVLAIGIPAFSQAIEKSRIESVTHEFHHAIEHARAAAVTKGRRTTLIAEEGDWGNGWKIFLDEDSDGVVDQSEKIISQRNSIAGAAINGTDHVKQQISFISSGEGRAAASGAFAVGKLAICPAAKGSGYQIFLSKGGRARLERITPAQCADSKLGIFN